MQRPTGEVTFCFTDIEGSTALVSDLGTERYERVLGEHRQLLRSAFQEHRGVEVNTEGDGMFYVWQHAGDAAAGCAAGQRALAAHNWPFGVVVRVRIGLHTGPAVATADGDYIGLTVHQASRISTAGHGGQIVLSPQTVQALEGQIPDGCAVDAVGEYHVRDFGDPIPLYCLTSNDLPDIVRPLRLPRAEPRNFGALRTSFVGRDDELAAVGALVEKHSLVTIVGPGGVGKTRLAREVARQVTGSFAGGVWLVELAGLDASTVGAVAAAIGGTVGVGVAPGQSPIDAVIDDLVGNRRLLVLDGCENVLDAVAEIVERVAAQQGQSQFLAATREALALRTEQRWPLTPLRAPAAADDTYDDMADNAAVALFVDRARAVAPSFAINESTAEHVAFLCRTLEGIPLALELAAARLGEIDITELAESAERVLELRGGYRTDPARHRTMRALVAWSAETLTPLQRTVYTRLAPLRGWSTRAAAVAAAMAGMKRVTAREAEAALDGLMAKSIVLTDEDSRLRMLDPVREHAAEELRESGDDDAVMGTLTAFAVRRRGELSLSAYQSLTELRRSSDLSDDTLRALLGWARDADPVAMAQLITTMQIDFVLGGHREEGLEWVDVALMTVGEEHMALRAALLHVGGSIAQTNGDTKLGRDFAERGLEVAQAALDAENAGRPTGAPAGIEAITSFAGAANTLGSGLLSERRVDEAAEMFERAAAAAGAQDRAMLVIRNNQASVHLARGDLAAAEAALREAAARAAATFDPNGPQIVLNVAALRGIAGDHAGAAAELEAGIELAKSLGAVQMLPMAVTNLGVARRNLGDPRALETLRAGLRMAREQQNLMPMVEGLKALADVYRQEPSELRAVAEDLSAVASRVLDDGTVAWAAALSAVAHTALGDHAAAEAARRQSVSIVGNGSMAPADSSILLLELANSLVDVAPERAARLLGAAEAAIPPGLPKQASFARVSESVRARLAASLGTAAEEVIDDGKKLDVTQALELAVAH